MQCFCYIMFDHLCSYTCDGIARDPHRLSDFLRACQRLPKNVQRVMKIPREKEGGKTNIVCVYRIPQGRGGQGKGAIFLMSFPPLLALLYIALLYTLMDLHFPCNSTTECIYDMDATSNTYTPFPHVLCICNGILPGLTAIKTLWLQLTLLVRVGTW